MTLIQRAYTELAVDQFPARYRRIMARLAEQHEGFDPSDIRVIEHVSAPAGECYAVITGSDATPGNQPTGVWAVYALTENDAGRPEVICRGDAVLSQVAAQRLSYLVVECGGKHTDLSGGDLDKRLRAQLKAAGKSK